MDFSPPPKYRGTGRLIAGGIVAGGGLAARLYVTAITHPIREGSSDEFLTDIDILLFGGAVSTPVLGAGLALIGSGLWSRGVWAADRDFRTSTAPRSDYAVRARLGWGLLGSGLSLWLVTRIMPLACGSDACTGGVLDGGFYPSLALVSAGVALAPFSAAYMRSRIVRGRLRNVSAGVVATQSYSGLSLRGRF